MSRGRMWMDRQAYPTWRAGGSPFPLWVCQVSPHASIGLRTKTNYSTNVLICQIMGEEWQASRV
jgi:hypothetical protein